MKLLSSFTAAAALLGASLAAAAPAVSSAEAFDKASVTEASHRRLNLRACIGQAVASGDADYAATRIANTYPAIRAFARHDWNGFRGQVARQMCRSEFGLSSNPVHVGPYSITVPRHLLARQPHFTPPPVQRPVMPRGPVIIIPFPPF